MRIAAIFLSLALQSYAGFKLPSGIYTFDQLEEAVAEAQEKQKPIAFLWSDTSST